MIVSVANLTTTETEIFETSPQLFVPKESNEKNLQMLKLPHRFLSVYSTLIHIIASFLCSSDVRGDFPATRFDLGTLTLSSLKLLGDAHLNNGTIKLTRELSVPTSTAGKALYGKPVKFRHPDTHSPASFTTYFSFTVTNLNPSSIGGGLAFVICPDGEYIGSSGGFLGLTEETGSGSGFVAVEFDTLMDVEFKDVNGNHVGLDLNAVVSAAVSDLGNFDIDLKSGNSVNSWITYDGSGRVLTVYVSYSNVKPESPILSVPLDLDRYVTDSMFVGFSGSTQGSTEIHSIDWWSFTSSFESSESPPPMSNSPPLSSSSASIVPSVSTVRRKTADPSSSCRNKLCKKSPAAVAGVVTAGAFFLALFAGVIIWVYSNKIKYNRKSESFPSEIIKSPREFTYKELKLATDSFSSSRVIGNGAFGTVYRGILPDSGETIAIKRCSHISQGNTEFLSELSLIGTLRHRNLLRLQGYCREKGEILLIYDLMPNGSLDKALYESPTTLPWPHRRQILRGVASALAYLHQECENQIIHRDVKTSNIMLDASFNPKLGDFGLARQTEHDKSPDATAAAGTMGYLAPEYLLTGRATEKTDVFSYGAVVLEVCTGRRPITRPEPEPGLRPGLRSSLVDWVWGLYREGKLLTAVDERLRNGGEFNPEEINRVLMVGLACSKPDPVTRPTMRSVVQILVGEADVPEVPIAKPSSSMSFSTSELLLTLQDSVSDCNEVLAPISTTSFSSSEHDIFIVGKDRSV